MKMPCFFATGNGAEAADLDRFGIQILERFSYLFVQFACGTVIGHAALHGSTAPLQSLI